jgi:hypothetical protein
MFVKVLQLSDKNLLINKQPRNTLLGIGGEERLLTVLYYDLFEISKRKRNGEHDDEDDDESD